MHLRWSAAACPSRLHQSACAIQPRRIEWPQAEARPQSRTTDPSGSGIPSRRRIPGLPLPGTGICPKGEWDLPKVDRSKQHRTPVLQFEDSLIASLARVGLACLWQTANPRAVDAATMSGDSGTLSGPRPDAGLRPQSRSPPAHRLRRAKPVFATANRPW